MIYFPSEEGRLLHALKGYKQWPIQMATVLFSSIITVINAHSAFFEKFFFGNAHARLDQICA